jgi:PAS domain S-box-containing protein
VEDSEDDAALLLTALRDFGFAFEWARVQTEPDFLKELQRQPDIIISDSALPAFSGSRATELLRASGSDIPFILVSGTVGEDFAVEAMKHGVTDYLLKDRLGRLGSAVEHALEQKRLREQRQQTETTLRESERRFRELLENVGLITMILDTKGLVVFCNDYLLNLTGWKREEIIGANWFDRFIPESDLAVRRIFFDTLEKAAVPGHYENPIVTRHGELRQIRWYNTMLRDSTGKVSGTASIGEDMTERNRAEESLRESEEKLRQLAENINEVFWLIDLQQRKALYVSPAYERIWGRPRSEFEANPAAWLAGVHPDDRERISEAARTTQIAGTYDERFRVLRPDGSVRWIRDRAFPVRNSAGEVYRIVGTAEDITESKKGEDRLREYQKVVEGTEEMIAVVDRQYRYVIANRAFLRYRGLTEADLIGKTVPQLLNVGVFETDVKHRIDESFEGRVVKYEMRYNYPELGERDLVISYFPIEETGRVDRVACILQDVTERKKAERQVRERDELIRLLLDSTAEAIYGIDLEGKCTLANRACARMLGYENPGQFTGKNMHQLIHHHRRDGSEHPEAACPIYQAYSRGEGTHIPDDVFWRADGSKFDVEIFSYPVRRNDQIIGAVVTFLDISDRKQLEEQIRQAQKMESIGMLAGGIAHDLNNVLAPILMACNLLEQEVRHEHGQSLTATIKGSAQRGADLVKQVLSFARGVEGRKIPLQPKHLIREVSGFIRETFPKSIRLNTKISQDLWLLSGDPTQLYQVLLNLCVNARDAMPNGGVLLISAENATIEPGAVPSAPDAKVSQYVVIRVADTGSGIAPEIRDKIFDPFFTTKEIGKGTGLGLSTTMAIVRSHAGFIKLVTELEKGSSFEVWLPARIGDEPSAVAIEKPPLQPGHGELILVVDDEASIRAIGRDVLQSYGYNALTATDGADAIVQYAQRKDEVRAVVTDIMMPVMDGVALIFALRRLNSAVPIIASGGLSNPEHQAKTTDAGANYFLPKPYTAEAFIHILQDALRSR